MVAHPYNPNYLGGLEIGRLWLEASLGKVIEILSQRIS
jgi:hypothetical protein